MQILKDASLQFLAANPTFDEEQFKNSSQNLSPLELCEALAFGKAKSLQTTYPDDVILGCDQLIDLDGEILGKSKNYETALKQLSRMSGKIHKLHSASAVLSPNKEFKVLTTTTRVEFRALSELEIQTYLKIEEPYDCAGSYKMEKAGLMLAKSISGNDPSAIQGLSLIDLFSALRSLNISYLQFLAK